MTDNYVSDAEALAFERRGGLDDPRPVTLAEYADLTDRYENTRDALLEAIEAILDAATFGATRMKTPEGIEASLKPVNKARDLAARIRKGEA
jgi:hypothetical protein